MKNIRDKIQAQAIEEIKKAKYQGIVDVAPRVGKSKIAIDAIRNLDDSKILIIAPFNPILDSWEKEFNKWNLDNPPDVINQRSLNKIDLSEYDLIISDEVHTLSDNQLLQLSESNILGFSGSIGNKTKDKLKKHLNISPIFTYSIDQAITDNIISDYSITVVQCQLDYKKKYIPAGTKKKPFKTTEYANYQYLTKTFNRFRGLSWNADNYADEKKYKNLKMMYANKRANLIYSTDTKLNACKLFVDKLDRCLIFTARTEAADVFGNSYHSKSTKDNLSKFINQDIDKLAVCEMTSMGITIPNLKIGVFHQMKSSEEGSIQKVLRMCNWEDGDNAEIYIFTYTGTVDEEWTNKALAPFDKKKIKFVNVYNLLG